MIPFAPRNSGSGPALIAPSGIHSLPRRTRMSIVESLKPLLLLLVLGGVGYAVYVALNHAPPPEFATLAPEWNKPPASDSANQNGAANNPAPYSNAAPGTAGNPWQSGTPGSAVSANGITDSASTSAGGTATMPAASTGGGLNSLPFCLGSNAAGSPVANAPPPNQALPPTATMPGPPSTNLNAAPAGSFPAPPTGVMNSPAPVHPCRLPRRRITRCPTPRHQIPHRQILTPPTPAPQVPLPRITRRRRRKPGTTSKLRPAPP